MSEEIQTDNTADGDGTLSQTTESTVNGETETGQSVRSTVPNLSSAAGESTEPSPQNSPSSVTSLGDREEIFLPFDEPPPSSEQRNLGDTPATVPRPERSTTELGLPPWGRIEDPEDENETQTAIGGFGFNQSQPNTGEAVASYPPKTDDRGGTAGNQELGNQPMEVSAYITAIDLSSDLDDTDPANEPGAGENGDPEEAMEEQVVRRRRRLPLWVEFPLLVLIALTIAVLIKTFLFQPFYIPSGSMLPTIQINDRVMVSKLSYRFGEPVRGDIIVFHNPYIDNGENNGILPSIFRNVTESIGIRTADAEDFIKRVVGLGGEELQVLNGRVLIDGSPIDEAYLPQGTYMLDFPPVEIPEGHVFVMGDNRPQSSDSRVFGPIPVEDVVGKAVLRVWPLSRFGGL